jgi:beta-glucanase (GH16 family)
LTGYKLTFDDEFNSFNWNSTGQPGDGTWQTNFYFGGHSLPSNGEQETYSDPSTGTNPFSITPSGDMPGHSQLDIQAQPDGNGGCTSGLITTEPSLSQTYGYFEMRAELPAGKGLWPAFWMLPTDKSWPPEIDALEAFGTANANGEGGSNQAHVGVISSDGSQNNGGWQTVNGDMTADYHNYGVLWDPQHITWYIDGQEVFQANTPADANKPMYLLANLAVGGNWPGSPDGSNTWPADMKIDYIHAYSNDPNAQAVTPQPGYAGPGNNTIKVGTGANILTGGGAHDLFVFSDAAAQGNTITDFKPGADELDLTGVLKSLNYQGQDPIADHVLNLVQAGNDTAVVIDPHANGDASAHTVVTLENVVASSLKAGHDFIWRA